ncbi:MAG: hypothetical protein M9944_08000 [Rhizobiaceae bacterium]|nr:hypothetical protein [Rhizobiaceae bacterium]
MTERVKDVEKLITKAATAQKSDDAMRFSQAACNAANALLALQHSLKA